MIRFFKPFLVVFIFAICSALANAQTAAEIKSMDVSKMSDAQVKQVANEIKQRGLSIDDAVMMARAKGATESQISEMKRRLAAVQSTSSTGSTQSGSEMLEMEDESSIDNEISQKEEIAPSVKNRMSKVFGFQFFNTDNLTFSPSVNIPISDNYVFGIGDELVINIYGASQQIYNVVVEKNGNIYIPDLGPINIVGLDFKSIKSKVADRMSAIYSGLKGDLPNTFVDVSAGELKAVTVNVVGEVNLPGTYNVPATATAFNALYLAGGPNEKGSFRKIDLLRNGKVLTTIDIYDYLVNGDAEKNIQLRDQDVILVHTYQNRIKVAGEFKRVGWFETINGEAFSSLLKYTGGFSENAYTKQIQVYRNNSRTLTFKDLKKDDFSKELLLNGDSIVAGKVIMRYDNLVTLEGAVYRPGNYELSEKLTLANLLQKADGVLAEAYMERGIITRLKTDYTIETIPFCLSDVLNGKSDVTLANGDVVKISSLFDLRESQTLEIKGGVKFPGKYAFAENMTLADLIYKSGGLLEEADVDAVEISRVLNYKEVKELSSRLTHSYQFAIDRNLKLKKEDESFVLKPFDKVFVRRAPGFRPTSTINVQGEVLYAGDYSLTFKGERISDIIKRAGGVTPESFIEGASLRRKHVLTDSEYEAQVAIASQDTTMSVDDIKRERYEQIGINLAKILANPGCLEDLQLKNGDELYVPESLEIVKVSGAVLNPVAHTFKEFKGVRQYVKNSGGFSQRAKRGKIYVVYANGTAKATSKGLFWRSYPEVRPGCEIIVPQKPQTDKAAASNRWMAIASMFLGVMTPVSIAIINNSNRTK